MYDWLAEARTLAAMCQPGGTMLPGGLLLVGLAGSVMHCAPMCGPFVLAQVGARMQAAPCASCRLGGLLPGYHIGRILTYSLLGALAGGIGVVPGLGWLAGLGLAAAALLFFGQALRQLAPSLGRHIPGMDAAPTGVVRLTGRLRPVSGLPLGVALGFLPCGLLFGALMAASAAGGPARGALAMLLFGLGTVPALLAIGVAGQAATRRWQHAIGRAAPVLLLLNAGVLGIMAVEML